MRLPPITRCGGILEGLLVCLLLLIAPGAHADGERLNIPVVNYSGKDQEFSAFSFLLSGWVFNLSEEIPASVGADYLRHLKLVERKTRFPSAADLDDYWKKGDALQVLISSIEADPGNKYFVSSTIYLGDLQGAFPHKTILIEVSFAARDYADAHDSHTAVLFYGLAMDAERVDSSHKELIARLLKSAKDRIADIKNRKSSAFKPESVLPELETAIKEAEKRLRAR